MPPYKILVELTLRVEERFRRFLNPREAVRGSLFDLVFTITNIGDEEFPGGTVGKITVGESTPLGGMGKDAKLGDESKIGRLKPGESWKPITLSIALEWEGVTKITLQVTASDAQPVEHYQNRNFPTKGEWFNFYFSVNRESLLILDILERITIQLGKSG
jgi:hypothetical protein